MSSAQNGDFEAVHHGLRVVGRREGVELTTADRAYGRVRGPRVARCRPMVAAQKL